MNGTAVIAVANLKGGCGKTTSAVYLSLAAAREGRSPVTLVDADPQASASEWLGAAPDPVVEVVAAPTPHRAEVAIGERTGLVVVDTPPGAGDERIVRMVLDRADAVVIPTRVGGIEGSRVQATLELVPARTRRGLVVAAARTGTRSLADALASWADQGLDVWASVPERVSIAAGPEGPPSMLGLVLYRTALQQALGARRRSRSL